MRRSIALFLSIALIFQASLTQAALSPNSSPSLHSVLPPESLGFITERFQGSSDRKVILIQDLHAHLDTQRKIAGLLEFYQSRGLLKGPVAIEGASGPWDLSLLEKYPASARRSELFDYLLQEAGLTGPEWFALTSKTPVSLIGVDSAQDSAAQRQLFRQTRLARELVAKQVQAAREVLDTFAQQTFKRKHKNWIKLTAKWNIAELSTSDYLRKTQRWARTPEQLQWTHSMVTLTLVERLLRQQATLEDIRQIAPREQDAARLTHSLIQASGQKSLFTLDAVLELLRASVDFYTAAVVRDQPLAHQTIQLAHQQGVAISVVGGFHTLGMVRELKQQGISYEVITPNITEDFTAQDEARYADRLAGVPVDMSGFLMQGATSKGGGQRGATRSQSANALLSVIQKMRWPRLADLPWASMHTGKPELEAWWKFLNAEQAKGRTIEQTLETVGFGLDHMNTVQRESSRRHFDVHASETEPILVALRDRQSLFGKKVAGYSRIRHFTVLKGPLNIAAIPQEIRGEFTVEQMSGVLLIRRQVVPGTYDLYVYPPAYSEVEALLMGPHATSLTRLLVLETILFHEHTEGHPDEEVIKKTRSTKVPRNTPVDHGDLVAYGATLKGLSDSIFNGAANDWLDRLSNDIGINWRDAQIAAELDPLEKNIVAGVIQDPDQIHVARLIVSLGMGYLFSGWSNPGNADDRKKIIMLQQLVRLNQRYPGGLPAYRQSSLRLIEDMNAKRSRFTGKVPLLPRTFEVNDLEGANSRGSSFYETERMGIARGNKTAVVLMAGGLGERLGYPGFKIGIPLSLMTGDTYFDWYVKYVLALQRRSNAVMRQNERIPLMIVTSDDTEQGILSLLNDRHFVRNRSLESGEGETYWERGESLVVVGQQDMVPSIDKSANFHVDPQDPYHVLAKPNGHGGVHMLLRRVGLARKWKVEGKEHIIFIQDTNAQSTNALPIALELNAREKAGMTFVAVPRKAGDNIGLIGQLADESVLQNVLDKHHLSFDPATTEESLFDVWKQQGLSLEGMNREINEETATQGAAFDVANVEYVIAKPALQTSVHKDGDFAEGASRRSPYPGNTNILVTEIDAYLDALEQTQGLMPEIVNFKKPLSRAETNMQDISEAISRSGKRVQVVRFSNEDGFVFSTAKNGLADGAKAQAEGKTPETMSTAEMEFYANMRKRLAQVGVRFESAGKVVTVKDVKLRDGAKVILMPSFAVSMEELVMKVRGGSVTDRSSLILDGEGIRIKSFQLDGGLRITVGPGVTLDVENFKESNSAEEKLVELKALTNVPAPLGIRGYDLEQANKDQARVIEIFEPGHYRLGPAGYLEKEGAKNDWIQVDDQLGKPRIRTIPPNVQFSKRWIAVVMSVLGMASYLLSWPLFILWGIPQIFKIAGFGDAEYDQGQVTGARASYQRFHELAHTLTDSELMVEFVLTPLFFWMNLGVRIAGLISKWLDSSDLSPEMAVRVAQLREFFRSGSTFIPDISGKVLHSDIAPSQVFGQITGYFETVFHHQRKVSYEQARAYLSAAA